MTTELEGAIRRVKATVEAVKVAPRTNEAPRIVLQLSTGFRNHEDLFVFLGAQMKQEIEFTLETTGVQGSLLAALGGLSGSTTPADDAEDEDEEETETVSMIVNGEDNQTVRRPRRSKASEGWAPHYFALDDNTPGLCGNCHLREDDAIHTVPEADLPAEAAALIEEANAITEAERTEPATPEEAEARAEAEGRLAARSR